MSAPATISNAKPRALVLIPGTVNYFYNLAGHRLAEALRDLGFDVDVRVLGAQPQAAYDWCILCTISEVMYAFGDKAAAIASLRELRKSCQAMTSLLLDSVEGPWYQRIVEDCRAVGIRYILDLSLHDQRDSLPKAAGPAYHYLPSGLTTSEARRLDDNTAIDRARPIPWAFVGHLTQARAALVESLVREVDPRGFVYIPQCAPYLEKGSPHLNQQQFEAVLRQTRYHVWCSHHSAFYMESERFRMSLLAGAIPVKVLVSPVRHPNSAPFEYLMVEEEDLAERLRTSDFEAVRQRFRDDFRQIKPLKAGLAEFLASISLLGGDEPSQWMDGTKPALKAA
jgi:hypothetical protein